MTAPTTRTARLWRWIGGIAAIVGIAGGTLWVLSALGQDTRTFRSTHDVAGLRTLDVSTDSGDVIVIADRTEGEAVTVRMRVTETLFGSRHEVRRAGDRLTIRGGCQTFWSVRCEVRIEVHVAPDLDVKVDTDNGTARVRGSAGQTTMDSDNGTLVADGVGGTLRCSTDNGDVEAADLLAREVVCDTDNGNVDLGFAAPPQRVVGTSDNGDVTVRVPAGGTYALRTATDNGSLDTPIRTDPGAERRIDVTTDNGDITVRYAPGEVSGGG